MGVVQLGSHLIKTWSQTQDSVTLGSAEAELVALSKLAAEVLGIRSMAIEWDIDDESCACQLYAEASAALGMAKRQGAGEMRHINVRTLWLQEKEIQKVLGFQTIRCVENPADGLAKHVRQELALQYARTNGTKLSSDRAGIELKLAG